MMNTYFFSRKTNGFYPAILKADYEASPNGWPDDAVAISEEDYNLLYEGQAKGKIIIADSKGYPVLTDPPEPDTAELIEAAEEKRNTLIAEATIAIAPLQDAIDLEEATEEEKSRLIVWKKYRVQLNRVDTGNAPDIVWPEKP